MEPLVSEQLSGRCCVAQQVAKGTFGIRNGMASFSSVMAASLLVLEGVIVTLADAPLHVHISRFRCVYPNLVSSWSEEVASTATKSTKETYATGIDHESRTLKSAKDVTCFSYTCAQPDASDCSHLVMLYSTSR